MLDGTIHVVCSFSIRVAANDEAKEILENCIIGSVGDKNTIPLFNVKGEKVIDLKILDHKLEIDGISIED